MTRICESRNKELEFFSPSNYTEISPGTKKLLLNTQSNTWINQNWKGEISQVFARTKKNNLRGFPTREALHVQRVLKKRKAKCKPSDISWSSLFAPLAFAFLPTAARALEYSADPPVALNQLSSSGPFQSCGIAPLDDRVEVVWDHFYDIYHNSFPYEGQPSGPETKVSEVFQFREEVQSIPHVNENGDQGHIDFWTETHQDGKKIFYRVFTVNGEAGELQELEVENPLVHDLKVSRMPDGRIHVFYVNRFFSENWKSWERFLDGKTATPLGDPVRITNMGMAHENPSGLYYPNGSRKTFLTMDGSVYRQSYTSDGSPTGGFEQIGPLSPGPYREFQFPQATLLPNDQGYALVFADVDKTDVNRIKGYYLLAFHSDDTPKYSNPIPIQTGNLGTTNFIGASLQIISNPVGADIIFRSGGMLWKQSIDAEGNLEGNPTLFGGSGNVSSFSAAQIPTEENLQKLGVCYTQDSLGVRGQIWQAPVPTTAPPTMAPTPAPTPFPTTSAPTMAPTPAPTMAPTPSPTPLLTTPPPTIAPTPAPTIEMTTGEENSSTTWDGGTGYGSTTGENITTESGTTGAMTTTGTTGLDSTTQAPAPSPTPEEVLTTGPITERPTDDPISDPRGNPPIDPKKNLGLLFLIIGAILSCLTYCGCFIYWCMRRRRKKVDDAGKSRSFAQEQGPPEPTLSSPVYNGSPGPSEEQREYRVVGPPYPQISPSTPLDSDPQKSYTAPPSSESEEEKSTPPPYYGEHHFTDEQVSPDGRKTIVRTTKSFIKSDEEPEQPLQTRQKKSVQGLNLSSHETSSTDNEQLSAATRRHLVQLVQDERAIYNELTDSEYVPESQLSQTTSFEGSFFSQESSIEGSSRRFERKPPEYFQAVKDLVKLGYNPQTMENIKDPVGLVQYLTKTLDYSEKKPVPPDAWKEILLKQAQLIKQHEIDEDEGSFFEGLFDEKQEAEDIFPSDERFTTEELIKALSPEKFVPMQEIFPSHKKEKKITSPKDISEEKTPHYGTFGRSQFEPKEENIDKLSTDPTIPHRGSDLRARSFHRDEDEGEKETGGMFVAIATKEDRKPRRTGTFGQEIHDDVDKLD